MLLTVFVDAVVIFLVVAVIFLFLPAATGIFAAADFIAALTASTPKDYNCVKCGCCCFCCCFCLTAVCDSVSVFDCFCRCCCDCCYLAAVFDINVM